MGLTDPAGRTGEGLDCLNGWQRAALGVAIVIVIGGMVGGFWSSFWNLYRAAAAHGWEVPALLPLCVDSGILAYVVLDQLAVTIGGRSRWLHYVAWCLAGFTVWANAAVAPTGGIWRVIYAAMPALWVLGVEALRFFWRLLRNGPAPKRDKIPAGRWLANPWTAAGLQRRMWLLGEPSWARMKLIEHVRTYAADVVREHERQGRTAPGILTSRIRSGELRGDVLDAIDNALRYGSGTASVETAADTWVVSLMVLPDRVAADLQTERRTIAQAAAEAAPGSVAGSVPGVARKVTPRLARNLAPDYSRKPSAKAAKAMSGTDLAPYVEAWIQAGGRAAVAAVARAFHVGDPKAREALEAVTGSNYAPARAPVAAFARAGLHEWRPPS
jgi:hypothetical protein